MHHHEVSGVAEDSPEALDLTAVPKVLGRERVAKLVSVHREAQCLARAAEAVVGVGLGDWATISQDQQVGRLRVTPC